MKSAKIFTDDFNRIISATKSFVSHSTSDSKWNEYIKLEFSAINNEVVAVAVDGFRMSVEHSLISDCDEDFVIFVKSNTRLPSKAYAYISLDNDGKEAMIRCDGLSFGYTQPNDAGFNWQKIIPYGDAEFKIAFNGNYLISALQAAKASCGNSFRHPVVLEFRGDLKPLLIRTNRDDIKMILPIKMIK